LLLAAQGQPLPPRAARPLAKPAAPRLAKVRESVLLLRFPCVFAESVDVDLLSRLAAGAAALLLQVAVQQMLRPQVPLSADFGKRCTFAGHGRQGTWQPLLHMPQLVGQLALETQLPLLA
jgi:hypothetical protein